MFVIENDCREGYNPCKNGGKWNCSTTGEFPPSCECSKGYSGDYCTTGKLVTFVRFAQSLCISYFCTITTFSVETITIVYYLFHISVDYCSGNGMQIQCLNGGTCVLDKNNTDPKGNPKAICKCQRNFVGLQCEAYGKYQNKHNLTNVK